MTDRKRRQPIGLRMLNFGRQLMRNYLSADELPSESAPTPPPAWKAGTDQSLSWDNSPVYSAPPAMDAPMQADNFADDYAEPAPRQPRRQAPAAPPAPAQQVQRQPTQQAPMGVQRSNKPTPTDLAAILRGHQEIETNRDRIREEKKAMITGGTSEADVQRKDDPNAPIPAYRRRGHASFQYVETSVLSGDEKPAPPKNEPPVPQTPAVEADAPASDLQREIPDDEPFWSADDEEDSSDYDNDSSSNVISNDVPQLSRSTLNPTVDYAEPLSTDVDNTPSDTGSIQRSRPPGERNTLQRSSVDDVSDDTISYEASSDDPDSYEVSSSNTYEDNASYDTGSDNGGFEVGGVDTSPIQRSPDRSSSRKRSTSARNTIQRTAAEPDNNSSYDSGSTDTSSNPSARNTIQRTAAEPEAYDDNGSYDTYENTGSYDTYQADTDSYDTGSYDNGGFDVGGTDNTPIQRSSRRSNPSARNTIQRTAAEPENQPSFDNNTPSYDTNSYDTGAADTYNDYDDGGSYDTGSDNGGFGVGNTPIQRTAAEPDNNSSYDTGSYDNGGFDVGGTDNTPVQRSSRRSNPSAHNTIQRTAAESDNNPSYDTGSDTQGSGVDNTPIQRSSRRSNPSARNTIQRTAAEPEVYDDNGSYDNGGFEVGGVDNTPIQRTAAEPEAYDDNGSYDTYENTGSYDTYQADAGSYDTGSDNGGFGVDNTPIQRSSRSNPSTRNTIQRTAAEPEAYDDNGSYDTYENTGSYDTYQADAGSYEDAGSYDTGSDNGGFEVGGVDNTPIQRSSRRSNPSARNTIQRTAAEPEAYDAYQSDAGSDNGGFGVDNTPIQRSSRRSNPSARNTIQRTAAEPEAYEDHDAYDNGGFETGSFDNTPVQRSSNRSIQRRAVESYDDSDSYDDGGSYDNGGVGVDNPPIQRSSDRRTRNTIQRSAMQPDAGYDDSYEDAGSYDAGYADNNSIQRMAYDDEATDESPDLFEAMLGSGMLPLSSSRPTEQPKSTPGIRRKVRSEVEPVKPSDARKPIQREVQDTTPTSPAAEPSNDNFDISMDLYEALNSAGVMGNEQADYGSDTIQRDAYDYANDPVMLDLLNTPTETPSSNSSQRLQRSVAEPTDSISSSPNQSIMRADAPPSSSSASSSSASASSSASSSEEGESEGEGGEEEGDVNVDKLARDVYSRLRNRLRIENERKKRI